MRQKDLAKDIVDPFIQNDVVAIGGAVVILFMLLGLLLGAIDIGISGAKRQMKQ